MSLVCCQIVRRAKFVSAQPWFEPGSPISVVNAKEFRDAVGQLAVLQVRSNGTGRIVEVLGSVDSVHAVMRGLLAEAGRLGDAPAPGHVLGEPSAAVRAQLAALPEQIPQHDEREDRRSDVVVTIDPATAKDHDDAIGLERAPSGAAHAWTLAVHIADVSAYVPTGSAIDQDALERAMSAYVPGTVAPMLPFELSSDLCSLRPGVDRGCVSAFIDLDHDGAVVGARVARTLIRSARRLSYDQVDASLAGRTTIDPVIDELVHALADIAAQLRARRMTRGALDMALPELELTLGETHVEAARMSSQTRSHQLVEECMLVANETVGDMLASADAPGIWRVHEHPEPEAIDALFASFESLGIPTPALPESFGGRVAARLAAQAAARAASYAEQSGRGRSSFAPRVLRALQRATYEAAPGIHSGLATERYAHFTSPIRRYPDLVVHRSVLELIGAEPSGTACAPRAISQVAAHVSQVEEELQKLERRADKIAASYLLHRRMHSGQPMGDDGDGIWRGEVVGLVGGGMFVRFGDVFEGFVPARTLGDERYELDDEALAMVGARSGHRWRIGDPIDVYVDKVERSSGRIDLRASSSSGSGSGSGASQPREARSDVASRSNRRGANRAQRRSGRGKPGGGQRRRRR